MVPEGGVPGGELETQLAGPNGQKFSPNGLSQLDPDIPTARSSKASDNDPEPALGRFRQFRLDKENNAISFKLRGVNPGKAPAPLNAAALGSSTAVEGFVGIALRNAVTGEYVLTARAPEVNLNGHCAGGGVCFWGCWWRCIGLSSFTFASFIFVTDPFTHHIHRLRNPP